jgi:hypothetical protein
MALVLSIVAISISGLTLLWTIGWSVFTHRRTTLARVTVKSSFSFPIYGMSPGDPAISITATNTGAVTVTVVSAQLRIKGKKETLAPVEWVVVTPQPLPIVLEPGEHWDGLVDVDSVLARLAQMYGARKGWKVRAYVRDPAGRTYEASEWIDLTGWAD